MRIRELDLALWAEVTDGVITVPPGPLPYRVGPDNQIAGRLSEEELIALNWQRVIVDRETDFDEDIQDMDTPIDTLVEGQVIRTMVYTFQPSPRDKMQRKLDLYFTEMAGLTSYLTAEFLLVEAEAKEGIVDGPLLSADVGVTRKSDGTVVADTLEAGAVVLEQSALMRARLAQLRTTRLKSKADIREADSDESAFVFYRAVVPA